jgi:hypothetical protein
LTRDSQAYRERAPPPNIVQGPQRREVFHTI